MSNKSNMDPIRTPDRARRPRELFPCSARQHSRFEYAEARSQRSFAARLGRWQAVAHASPATRRQSNTSRATPTGQSLETCFQMTSVNPRKTTQRPEIFQVNIELQP